MKTGFRLRKVLLLPAAALLVLAAVLILRHHSASAGTELTPARRSEEEDRIIRVYKATNEAVVFITTVTLTVDPFDFFPEIKRREGSGSGIIIDEKRGIVLTNLHVIEEASGREAIRITTADGQTYEARLVGLDADNDIALLAFRNPPARMVSLRFGD